MRTVISNNIYVYNCLKELRDWAENNLIVTNPTYETLMRIGKQDQIIRKHISDKMRLFVVKNGGIFSNPYGDIVIPFGCLNAIWNYIKDEPFELKLNNAGDISCKNDKITQPLFDYQEEAVQKMIAAKGGILIGGTGSGKTNCGIEIIHRIGKKFLWLTHTKDLVRQSYERMKKLYPNMKVGTVSDGKIEFGVDGTIATVQTMVTLDKDLYRNDFDIVMVDECHHTSGSPELMKMFAKVVEAIPARYKYGITASEKRNDSLTKTIYTILGTNTKGEFAPVWRIDRNDTNTLTAEHIKVELETPFSYEMLNPDGTFNYPGLVDYIAENEYRNNAIVEKIVEVSKDQERKQLVLCSRISQCEELYNRLCDAGIQTELLIGKVSAKKREKVLNEKVDWQVIVATVSLAKEGLDLPNLNTLHLVSCIANESDTIQSVGRIERFKEGKIQPIVYDYVDINIPYLNSKYKKRVNWLKRRK